MKTKDIVLTEQIKQGVRAVESVECGWGTTTHRLLAPLKSLADLYFAAGMYEESERVCWRVLSIAQKLFGDESIGAAEAMQSLAEALEVQGLFDQAERYYLWALNIRRKNNTAPDSLIESYARLVNLYRQSNEGRKAFIVEEGLALCVQIRNLKSAALLAA